MPKPPDQMASIEIRTTQNVTIEYELATLRDRFFAFFIDLFVFYALYILGIILLASIFGDYITNWGYRFLGLMQVSGLMLYHLLSLILMGGRSIGKKAVHLKVVRLDGQEPGMGDYLLRSLFLLLDFIFSAGVLGGILISSTFRGQRLGDLAANTAVVRERSQLHFKLDDILNIQSIENYQPQYPAVKQLSEQDVLLLKNTLTRYQARQNPAHATAIGEAAKTVAQKLGIVLPKGNHTDFLKTLIRDYIVLTR